MKRNAFLQCLQRNVAQRSIGPSTVRGAGRSGVGDAVRVYLADLDLGEFTGNGPHRFERALDVHTDHLVARLPRGARHWGLARKCLNIFLRDATNHHVLRRQFRLARIETRLELPLDRHTAVALHARDPRRTLPRWKTIKHLTPEGSARFQAFARSEAASVGVTRVFLDALYWRGDDR